MMKEYPVLEAINLWKSKPNPKHHGKLWTSETKEALRRYFNQGLSLVTLCQLMGRRPGSLLPKLMELKLIELSPDGSKYIVVENKPIKVDSDHFPVQPAEMWMKENHPNPARSVEPWTDNEIENLSDEFRLGHSLSRLCINHQRPVIAVLTRLLREDLIEKRDNGEYYRVRADYFARTESSGLKSQVISDQFAAIHDKVDAAFGTTFISKIWDDALVPKMRDDFVNYFLNRPTQELTMIPTIETKTFIQGQDATQLTDEQILAKIYKLEQEAKRWDNLENRPKSLEAQVAQFKADAKALAEFIDARNAPKPA